MATNPLVRFVMALFAILILVVSFFIGAMVFMVMLGLAFILSLVTVVRVWWLRRKLARQGVPPAEQTGTVRREIHIIEGRFERED